eukprot:UN07964
MEIIFPVETKLLENSYCGNYVLTSTQMKIIEK